MLMSVYFNNKPSFQTNQKDWQQQAANSDAFQSQNFKNSPVSRRVPLKNRKNICTNNLIAFTGTKLSPAKIREIILSGKFVPYKTLQENYLALTDIFNRKLTPVDNEYIIAQRKAAAESFTYPAKPPEFDNSGRETFKVRLAERLYNVNIDNRKYEKHAEIVIGLSGAGKTPVAEALAKKNGALLIDGDVTRELEPQYTANAANKYYKEEQKEIEKIARQRAIKEGANFVHNLFYRDETPEQLIKIAKELKENGYQVKLTLVDLPHEEAAKRIVERNIRTNRFMDPLEVYCVGSFPRHNYEILKHTDYFDGYSLYSNLVPFGSPAKLTERIIPKRKKTRRRLNLTA